MKLIVDRIDDGIAVCEAEEQTFLKIPQSVLPKGCKEGSVILFRDDEYIRLPQEEAARKSAMLSLQSEIFKS